MLNKINFFASPHSLAHFDICEPILLALSGGADSSCLLHLLFDYSKNVGCRLYAAHVNHNIRTTDYANEADRDEQFCRELCQKLGVELFVLSIDVPTLAQETGESLETAARAARYSFFADIMLKHGIKILATAHNADDNLETQIFNLCRGCSTDGLCGIPRVRCFDDVEGAVIVRPILNAPKAEILEFCNTKSIGFVTDSTNLEDDCTRNRIRHNIIPELVSLFGNPQKASIRLSKSAEQDSSFIRSHAEKFIKDTDSRIPLDRFCDLMPSVASRVLSTLFHKKTGASLEAVHIDALMGISHSRKEGASVSLPDHTSAIIKNEHLIFVFDTDKEVQKATRYERSLVEGINFIEDCPFAVAVHRGEEKASVPENFELYSRACLYIKELSDLTVRNRNPGDLILDGGMHKKLKKLMCDKKINAYDRDVLPIICDGGQVIYAPLCAVADDAKKHKEKQKISVSIYKKSYIKRIDYSEGL